MRTPRTLLDSFRRRVAIVPFVVVALVLAVGALGVSALVGTTSAVADTATHLVISVPSGATAGDSLSLTVSALDSTNTIDTTYSGSVEFSSSDDHAILPASSTLTNGTGTFTATLETAGSQTVTATDTADGTITGTSNAVTITSAAATHLIVSAPSTATQGTAFSYEVTAEDQYGNVDESYSGTVAFTSTDSDAALPADDTLSDGTGSFVATLNTTGNQTITATDTEHGSIDGTSDTIVVSTATTTTTTPTATTATTTTPAAANPVAATPSFTG